MMKEENLLYDLFMPVLLFHTPQHDVGIKPWVALVLEMKEEIFRCFYCNLYYIFFPPPFG